MSQTSALRVSIFIHYVHVRHTPTLPLKGLRADRHANQAARPSFHMGFRLPALKRQLPDSFTARCSGVACRNGGRGAVGKPWYPDEYPLSPRYMSISKKSFSNCTKGSDLVRQVFSDSKVQSCVTVSMVLDLQESS